ncbi:hypothetical protein COSO111634_35430 [Corallococcus soli]
MLEPSSWVGAGCGGAAGRAAAEGTPAGAPGRGGAPGPAACVAMGRPAASTPARTDGAGPRIAPGPAVGGGPARGAFMAPGPAMGAATGPATGGCATGPGGGGGAMGADCTSDAGAPSPHSSRGKTSRTSGNRQGKANCRPSLETWILPWMAPLSMSSSMVGAVSGPHVVPRSLRTQYCRTSPSAMCRPAPIPDAAGMAQFYRRRHEGPSARPSGASRRVSNQGVAPSMAASPTLARHAASACCSAGGSKQCTSLSNTLHMPAGVPEHATLP